MNSEVTTHLLKEQMWVLSMLYPEILLCLKTAVQGGQACLHTKKVGGNAISTYWRLIGMDTVR